MNHAENDTTRTRMSGLLAAMAPSFLLCFLTSAVATAQSPAGLNSADHLAPIGPGNVIVTPKFGGYILGFDIDPTGTEGLLSEFNTLQDGNFFIATETFDQKTGKILKVLAKENDTQNNYVTRGVFGKHVGLDEFYQPIKHTFPAVKPLSANKFTGTWTPPLTNHDLLYSIRDDQESPEVAVLTFKISNGGPEYATVFASNVAANTFGPKIVVKDPIFSLYYLPVLAFDNKTDEALLAANCPNCSPDIALVDLKTGKIRKFAGIGFGSANGIAVDSDTGIAVTTTVADAGVEFYDLAKQTGFEVTLPCSNGEEDASGADVEFDALHKLFLVQQVYNLCDQFSRLYVYDEKGNVVETLTGFQILPVSPTLIALHPSDRSGFVFASRLAEALQSFTY
jgi:hypothetical protein